MNYIVALLLSFSVAACGVANTLTPGDDDDANPGQSDAGPDGPGSPDAGPTDEDGDGHFTPEDCDDSDGAVNSDSEEVKGNGKDDDCDGQLDEIIACATGGDFTTIQAAVDAAPAGGAVNVCAGSYGRLSINKPVVVAVIEGVATLNGGGSTVVNITGTGEELVSLTGFTITGGGGGVRCSGSKVHLDSLNIHDNAINGSGGGVYLNNCTGVLANSSIKNNRADQGGGVFQHEGSVAIENNEIIGNTAIILPASLKLGIGAGVYLFSHASVSGNTISNNIASYRGGGIVVEDHNPVIDGNTVNRNESGDDGAGLFVIMNNDTEVQTITITNNTFEGNKSEGDAGGIRLLGAKATITGNMFIDNTAVADGGGIKASHDKSLIGNNIFIGNRAGYAGGGLEIDDDASTVTGCIIMNNHAHHGGGVNYHENMVPFKMENTLIANNTASDEGAGINIDEGQESVGSEFNFVTIVGNSSPQAGGASFEAGQAVEVTNSIIAFNSGAQVRFETVETWEGFFTGYPSGWKYNNVYPMNIEGMSYSGSGNISADPKFVSSSDFHLQATSPSKGTGEGGADMGAYGGPGAL